MRTRILLVPLQAEGGGTGHLRRCLELARHLGERAVVLAEEGTDLGAWRDAGWWHAGLATTGDPGGAWDLVVLDRRSTTAAELGRLAPASPVLALDEGGEARAVAEYALDVIPGSGAGRGVANAREPWLLELPPPARTTPPARIESILISFGGEDPLGLTERVLDHLEVSGLEMSIRVTVVVGGRFGREIATARAKVVRAPDGLEPLFGRHDLVVTSYGLTAYEALAAGTPVLLYNPTPYHERLARIASIPSLGFGPLRGDALRRRLARPGPLGECVARIQAGLRLDRPSQERGYAGLAARVAALADSLPEPRERAGRCPVCGSRHPTRARFGDRTCYRCTRTGLDYAVPFPAKRRDYTESYFFDEYRAQYGKTYLEDFESIRAASRGRLAVLSTLMAAPGPIVDIGCAYGPFLAACRDAGYRAAGLDVAVDAVDHVRKALGFEAWVLDFAAGDLGPLRAFGPRALTLWYVIEHFVDLDAVLTRANALLPLGGVLAFSTPNSTGVSSRADHRRFLERSPMDHYTIWSPAVAARVLPRWGFTMRRTRVTGHHPERSRLLAALGPAGRWVSRLFGLGDTFEAYAVKTGEVGEKHG